MYDVDASIAHVVLTPFSFNARAMEYIAPIPEDDFLAQLYRSAFFHILAIGGCLPEKEQKRLGNTVWSGVENLAAKFPPCGLFAHLKGDLKLTLGGYL